jgi:hypothetical protein
MPPEDLRTWTPIALTVEPPEPTLDWCDLRGVSFREPFFTQTVERWTTGVWAMMGLSLREAHA